MYYRLNELHLVLFQPLYHFRVLTSCHFNNLDKVILGMKNYAFHTFIALQVILDPHHYLSEIVTCEAFINYDIRNGSVLNTLLVCIGKVLFNLRHK